MALLTASDFYRDYYFYKIMNGRYVKEQDKLAIEPPKDLQYFINKLINNEEMSTKASDSEITGTGSENSSSVKQYKAQHPTQHSTLQDWVEDHRILTKEWRHYKLLSAPFWL